MPSVFSSNGTLITQWGGYGSDTAAMRSPVGIALDQEGNVYVADTGNNRIQVFSSNGTLITQWGEPGDEAQLMSPEGIAVDSLSGNVYVANTANNFISALSSRFLLVRWLFQVKRGRYMVMT